MCDLVQNRYNMGRSRNSKSEKEDMVDNYFVCLATLLRNTKSTTSLGEFFFPQIPAMQLGWGPVMPLVMSISLSKAKPSQTPLWFSQVQLREEKQTLTEKNKGVFLGVTSNVYTIMCKKICLEEWQRHRETEHHSNLLCSVLKGEQNGNKMPVMTY
jgi:hypothetical protein